MILFPHFYGRFIDHDGVTYLDGKAYWPSYITIQFDRRRALEIIETLAHQLQQSERTDYTIDFVGDIHDMERE